MNTDTKKQAATEMNNGSQMRITEKEMELIQRHFKDNDTLLLLMRKIFLPEIDPNAPVGQVIDLWMTVNIKDMTPEMAYQNIMARNMLISHVDQQLMTLKLIARMEKQTPEEAVAKVKANSTK